LGFLPVFELITNSLKILKKDVLEHHLTYRNHFPNFLLLLIISLLIGCSPTDEPTSKKKKHRSKTHLVKAITLQFQSIQPTILANGSLEYRQFRRIYAQENGQLLIFPFYEGDQVKQGQQIFKLNDQLLNAQLSKAKAQLTQAQQNLSRIQNLNNKRAASKDALGQARTEVTIAKADVNLLTIRLSFTQGFAPYDGIVTNRLVELGDVVKQYSHLLTLVDPSSLMVKANLSEISLAKIQPNTQVNIRIDALGEQYFKGHIQRIHPQLNNQTRQGILEIRFDQIPKKATSGQFARLDFQLATHQGILIPFNSVQLDPQGSFVWTIMDKKAHKIAVTKGIRLNQSIEIVTGLKPNDQLIIQGFLGLSQGKSIMNLIQAKEITGEKP